jgi:hypothetical protein
MPGEDELKFLARLKGKREGGTLHNWRVVKPYYTDDDDRSVVMGDITGDSRFDDGDEVTTTRIIEIFEDKYLETKNTYYKLGKKRVQPSGSSSGGK